MPAEIILDKTPVNEKTNWQTYLLRCADHSLYTIAGVDYYVATDRYDFSAGQVAKAYKLRRDIETFFKWWKKHLKVYHLIARRKYGLMVQILGGLISYLLMVIYCHGHFGEAVSIRKVRQLRNNIQNEIQDSRSAYGGKNIKEQKKIIYKNLTGHYWRISI